MRKLKQITMLMVITVMSLNVNAKQIGNLSINGYFSFEYENHISGDEEGDTNGSFDLDLIDLLIGYKIDDKFRFAADLTWEHGASTEDSLGNVAVEYAFGEYRHADWLQIRAGKHFTNFGIYNEIHTAKPAYISVKEPLSTNKNTKLGSQLRFYPRWGTGLTVLGDFPTLITDSVTAEYVLQVSNGETEDGENPYEEDDNTHKAVNGRINFDLSDYNLIVGVSFYNDLMDAAEDYDGAFTKAEIRSHGMHLNWYSFDNTEIEIEYVTGTEDFEEFDQVERDAYTVMIMHHFSKGFTPYFRYESLDPNKDVKDDLGTLAIVGMNFKLAKMVNLKFEINRFETEINNAKGEAEWTELKAAFVLGF